MTDTNDDLCFDLLCYGHRTHDAWEAICVDLDIMVAGHSFTDARDRLHEAVSAYILAALQEDDATCTQLLNRRAPLRVRAFWFCRFAAARLFAAVQRRDRRTDGNSTLPFVASCRA